MSSRISQTVATQIRVLRQNRDMSQKDLANAMQTSQNAISRLESPRYGKPNISTLRKIAAFFDVGLVVRFAPFSEIADWTSTLSEKSLNVPSFQDDPGFIERKGPRSENMTPASMVIAGSIPVREPGNLLMFPGTFQEPSRLLNEHKSTPAMKRIG